MDKFRVIHDYNKLVRRDMAEPLKCEKDGFQYVPRLNDGVNPLLKCYACGGTLIPGDKWWNEIERIVKERLK